LRGDCSKLRSPSAKSSCPPEPYPTKLDNSSYRVEYFDEEGQRTDVKTAYIETASSLQRGFSPEVEIRPEVTTRRSMQMHRKGSSSLQIVPNRNFVRYGPPGAA
jgi:hypothetical protein